VSPRAKRANPGPRKPPALDPAPVAVPFNGAIIGEPSRCSRMTGTVSAS